ncbi:MAG: hypothetical protein MJA82_07600 [Clostridia bacterium]|nr:hypothetical protein [Clostridia bacterium]
MLSLAFLIIGIFFILISTIFILKQSSQIDEEAISEEFLQNDDELVITIESLENIIDDINDTFNDTINQIERKYEFLESKIQHVDKKVLENYDNNPRTNLINEADCENNENNNINVLEEKDNGRNNKVSEIFKLKHEGLSLHQIAKKLNMGTGEVMLILNLKKARK